MTSLSHSLRPLVICGPSGSGKSTLLKRILEEFGESVGFCVSHTTRKPRFGEVNGKDYYFVDINTMDAKMKNDDFIETAEYSGNTYGTSKKAVFDVENGGCLCILDIEIEGVKQVKKTHLNPYLVFIKPPDLSVLENRLRERDTDAEEAIQKRLTCAREEIRYGEAKGNFDLVIVNEDVNVAYETLRNYVKNVLSRSGI